MSPLDTSSLYQFVKHCTSQGYSHSVEECDEIISDYEMKDVQVLSKVSTVNLLQFVLS